MSKHPLEVPAFLKRGKDNRLPKAKVKAGVIVKRSETPQASPLDALSPNARRLAEIELNVQRAQIHWFNDPATCEHYERLAAAPSKSAMPDDVREELRAKKRQAKSFKPSKEGLIGIATIAKELKIIPRVARAALRGSKVKKPDLGWHFATDEIKHIKETITSWLSKQNSSEPRNSSEKSKQKSSKTQKASSSSSTPATPKKTSGKRVARSTDNAKPSSDKNAKASGSFKRAAKTATAIGTKAFGRTSGTKPSSSTSKKKRK